MTTLHASPQQETASAAQASEVTFASSGVSDDSLGLSASETSVSAPAVTQAQAKVSRPRVTIAEPEVEAATTTAAPAPMRRSPPGTVAADIEAAMESHAMANKEGRNASLLPGDDALAELGSPVTQLQARLSQAKKAFSDLREGQRP